MMGGGFGGCTINIVQENKIENFTQQIQQGYQQQFAKTPEIYVMELEEGAGIISQ